VREVERLRQTRKRDREQFVARASSTDPQAHVMRNGEGGTVPSYSVQLVTDTTHGLVVNIGHHRCDRLPTSAFPGPLQDDAGLFTQADSS
jgi:hypothetical protein